MRCVVFVLCSCRDPVDLCPSFRSVWFVAALTFEVSGRGMGGDGFQTQRKKSWAERVLADAITIDDREERQRRNEGKKGTFRDLVRKIGLLSDGNR